MRGSVRTRQIRLPCPPSRRQTPRMVRGNGAEAKAVGAQALIGRAFARLAS